MDTPNLVGVEIEVLVFVLLIVVQNMMQDKIDDEYGSGS